MSISAEEKVCYLRETAIVLARERFHTDRTHTGGLRVLLDGAPLCEVTENGGITIEDGSRELQLIRERDGRVTNSVVHTQTRDSENERQRIDQIALLDIALRFNPDIICVGEMRGPEANAAQEAARVGIAVLTTIHSNSSEGTYRRMVSLCKRAVDTPDDTLMGYVTEAYPIVVYCRQLENKQRRITNISECEILPDGSRRLHKLYEYHITDNHQLDTYLYPKPMS